jgi:hypothetical protein
MAGQSGTIGMMFSKLPGAGVTGAIEEVIEALVT